MVKPGDDVNEKCNMANTDCGTGGKVDEKVVNASVASAELESSAQRSKRRRSALNSKRRISPI